MFGDCRDGQKKSSHLGTRSLAGPKDHKLKALGVKDIAKSQAQKVPLLRFSSRKSVPSPDGSVTQHPGQEQPAAHSMLSVISLERDESTFTQRPSGLQSENRFRKNKAKGRNVTKNYLFIAFELFKGVLRD